MREQYQVTTIEKAVVDFQYQLLLKARAELFKSFTMHQEREEFLKRFPLQNDQVKKGIGVAQFHKIATAKYADLSFQLIQNLLSMSNLKELQALREIARNIQAECEEMKETNKTLHNEFGNALNCVHEVRQFAENANPENYTTEQYATTITAILQKHKFV